MDVRDIIIESLQRTLVGNGIVVDSATIQLERPANRSHGDWSTNTALVNAKAAGSKPLDLANSLVDILTDDPPLHVTAVKVAGPGFINFYLADTWLHDILINVVESGVDNWGRFYTGVDQHVIVEFVSANPTGPLHAGHGRGACYGDSIARLLERCGHPVTREFYVNDRGTQVRLFGESLRARASNQELPEDGYHGSYIAEWAADMPSDVQPSSWGVQRAIMDQKEVLGLLNISFDTWFSELSMVESGAIEDTLTALDTAGASYNENGAIWLRSSDYGDDKDRVLVKSDGDYTYLLPDVAYHRDKFSRAPQVVNVWGADHHGYIARMRSAVTALGHKSECLEVIITQMVSLQRDGEEVQLSKRTGEIIELNAVIEEVGSDAARFTYLLQSVDSSQIFDLELAASQVSENPVFYVQYAHARVHSIVARANEKNLERLPLNETDLSLLTHDRELAVLRSLQELPEIIYKASSERSPHQITTWVRDLASLFHGFYHDCRVIGEDVGNDLTQARLWLVEATRIGLVVALNLLGVNAPTEMWREEADCPKEEKL